VAGRRKSDWPQISGGEMKRRRGFNRHPNYDEATKAAALERLRLNGGNVKLTARQVGIKSSTLASWSCGRNVSRDVIVADVLAKVERKSKALEALRASIGR